MGLTWQVIEDIKLRGTVTRDIRAPNTVRAVPARHRTNQHGRWNVPLASGQHAPTSSLEQTVGNPDLSRRPPRPVAWA